MKEKKFRVFLYIHSFSPIFLLQFGEDFVHSEEKKKWIEALKIGDEVDAVKVELKYKKFTWSRAIITDLSPLNLKISFKNDVADFERF